MPSPAVGILVDLSIPKQEAPPPLLSPPPRSPPHDESPSASSPVDASNSPSETARPAEDTRGALQEEDLLECETFDFACVSPKSLDGSKCYAEDEAPHHEVGATLSGSNTTATPSTAYCTAGKNTPLCKVKPLSPLKPRQMVELFKEANALACHISINYGSAKKERRMCGVGGGGGGSSSPALGSPGRRPSSSRSPMMSPGCRQARAAGCPPSKGQKEQAWTSMKENIPIEHTRGTETIAVPQGGCSVACTSMPPPALPAGLPYDRRCSGRLAARGSQTAAASRRVSLHVPSGDGVAKLAAGSRRSSVGPGRGGASSARGSADIVAAAAAQRWPAGHLTPRPGSAAAAAATGCRSSSSSVESVSATAAAAAATAIRSRPMTVRAEATSATVHTRRSLAPQGTASLLGTTKAGGTPAALLESATGNGRRTSAVGARAADTVAVPAARRRSSAIVGVGVHRQPSSAPIAAAAGASTSDFAAKEQQQPPLRAPYELRRSLRAPGAAPAASAASCGAESLVKAHGSIAVKSSLQKPPPSAANGGLSSMKPGGPSSTKSSSGAAASVRPAVAPALRPMKAVQPAAATASSASARAAPARAAGGRAAVLPSMATSSRRTSSIGIGGNGRSAIPSTAAAAAVASRVLPPTGPAVATPKNRRSLLPTRLPSASLSARTQCNGSSEQLSALIDLGASPVL